MFKPIRFQYLTVVWTVLVLVLCNIPMGNDPKSDGFFFEGFDKLVHTGFFFVLTTLIFYGKIKQQKAYFFRTITVLKIILVTAALGALIEMLQWKVFTYRSAEWWDFSCDMIGVGMGIFSYILLPKMKTYGADH